MKGQPAWCALGQVLLYKPRAKMYINLNQGRVINAAEAVDLTGFDDENVTCASFEFLSVDGPEAAALPYELDFVVRMAMGPGATPREGAEEEHGDIHVAVLGPNELVRTTLKGQVFLTNAVHPADAPVGGGDCARYSWTVEQSLGIVLLRSHLRRPHHARLNGHGCGMSSNIQAAPRSATFFLKFV